MPDTRRILLIDPVETSRENLASRLNTLGYDVLTANDGAEGAYRALEDPPHAVVADLFMPSISGAQLCRLLTAEIATAGVPVILRGAEVHRNRFWAEQTGALTYVVKGRMGDLIRALQRGFAAAQDDSGFFTAYSAEAADVRDRIAHHLDVALFASVIAAEVRNLAVCESFDRLFDLFAQFTSQVTNYRWLSVVIDKPFRGGLHSRPGRAEQAKKELFEALKLKSDGNFIVVEDDDAAEESDGPEPLVREIRFGDTRLGSMAMAPRLSSLGEDIELIDILAKELGGPLRTATLVEESRRLARFDSLTGLYNRRAFAESGTRELQRAKRHLTPLSVLLLDIDHFKSVNDTYGHATGDRVLQAMGKLLADLGRVTDINARWGGEEFVVLMPETSREGALKVGERTRKAIEDVVVLSDDGKPLSLSASIGVSTLRSLDTIDTFLDRADKAMYVAKSGGRNRVCSEAELQKEAPATPKQDDESDDETASDSSEESSSESVEESATTGPEAEDLDNDAQNSQETEVA